MFIIISVVLTFNLEIAMACKPFNFVSANGTPMLEMSAFPEANNNIQVSVDIINVTGSVNITAGLETNYMEVRQVLNDTNMTFSGLSQGAWYSMGYANISTAFEIVSCRTDCCSICTPINFTLTGVRRKDSHIHSISYLLDTTAHLNISGTTYEECGSQTKNVAVWKVYNSIIEVNMDLKNDTDYILKLFYVDNHNRNSECDNHTTIMFHVPENPKIEEDYQVLTATVCFPLARTGVVMSTREYIFVVVILTVLSVLFIILLRSIPKFKTFMRSKSGDIEKISVASNPSFAGISRTSTCSGRQEINLLYIKLEEMEKAEMDPYEFPRSRIELKTKIGGGAFGEVYYSKAHGLYDMPGYTLVAVKKLRDNIPEEEANEFLSEIAMLKHIGSHRNIVKLLACVTKSEPYMAVMELVLNGDLSEYLLNIREKWEKKDANLFFTSNSDGAYIGPPMMGDLSKDAVLKGITAKNEYLPSEIFEECSKSPTSTGEPVAEDVVTPLIEDLSIPPEPALDNKELENFALQIASGMAYLEKIGVVHRDLAARNILITRRKTLKITDFGMSRPGPYVNRNFRRIPLRWMALEAILQMKTDNKSDVWAFGVVLWEIGTLGAYPYNDIENEYVVPYLQSGKRLNKPETCTHEHYELMLKCWSADPNQRPSFAELVDSLSISKHGAYVDFSKINPKYVFPPPDPSRSDDLAPT